MTTTLKGMVSAFMSTRRLRNLSPNNITFYSQHLNKFLDFMESHHPDAFLEQIDHTVLREYVSGLKENHSAGGVNHHIKVLKILFKFMVEEGVIKENPTKKVSRVKTDQTAIATFSNEQIMAMLKITTHQMDFPGIRNYALITLLYDTGCRISELLELKVDDIQLDEKILTVKGKGGRGRVVPFGDRSLIGLVKYLNRRTTLFGKDGVLFLTKFGDPLTRRMTNKIIERIGEKAKVENVRLSAHTFRHTFAKNWLMNGGDLFSLQKILGHRTLDMVRNYVNITFKDIQLQHSKFSPGDNLFM
ncbi:MAG: tyrosine-type recombinase/integrase [Deltaproteobacteria bacterium]|nr:tyrosine-type recombinase/integrase [Deltaproteobacteria bacterium]